MKNKIYWAGGILLIIIVGAMMFGGGDSINQENKNKVDSNLSFNTDTGVKCKNIVGMGTAGKSESTMYFYKDLARYDSVITHKDMGKRDMHMIIMKDKSYVWGSGFTMPGLGNTGLIFNSEEGSDFAPPVASDIEELKKNNFNVPGMDCEEWAADENAFALPKDIKFSTEQELMGGMMQKGMKSDGMPNVAIPNFDCKEMCKQVMDKRQREECENSCEE